MLDAVTARAGARSIGGPAKGPSTVRENVLRVDLAGRRSRLPGNEGAAYAISEYRGIELIPRRSAGGNPVRSPQQAAVGSDMLSIDVEGSARLAIPCDERPTRTVGGDRSTPGVDERAGRAQGTATGSPDGNSGGVDPLGRRECVVIVPGQD